VTTIGERCHPEVPAHFSRVEGPQPAHLQHVMCRPPVAAADFRGRFSTHRCACVAANPKRSHPEVPAHFSRAEGPQPTHLQQVMSRPPVAAADFRGRFSTHRCACVAAHPKRCHPEVPAHFGRAEGPQPTHSQPTLRAAAFLSDLCAPSANSVLNSPAFSSLRPLRASSARSALKIFSLSFGHA
jgi:hypothetical protein